MILHLGGDSILFTSAIVAIISTDALRAKGTRTFFARIKEQGRFVPCSGKAASLVIAQEKGETRVYASPVLLQSPAAPLRPCCTSGQRPIPNRKETNHP